MESKYYTPSIEEFRVGFEYERLLNESGYNSYWKFDLIKSVWSKRVFTQSDFDKGRGWDNRRDLEDGYIRVKYLDQSDIESLGFKYMMTSYDGYWKKGEVEIGFTPYDKKIQISTGGWNILVDIKNINELRVLLKQLGIE
jgi:hypothetical protein